MQNLYTHADGLSVKTNCTDSSTDDPSVCSCIHTDELFFFARIPPDESSVSTALSSAEASCHTVIVDGEFIKCLLHEVLHGEVWALGVCRET